MTEPNEGGAGPSWRVPLDTSASLKDVKAALLASEIAIPEVLVDTYSKRSDLTNPDLYAIGIVRRATALSSGFRSMVELRNGLCALPIVRMQLDTALRLYAGFFVSDHFAFCQAVINGTKITQLKADDGSKMFDNYLLKRVAQTNPWMLDVYELTSGHVHFSHRHIREALRDEKDGKINVVIGPNDHDREPAHFQEPMRCMHHLNLVIECALRDWLSRMCLPRAAR